MMAGFGGGWGFGMGFGWIVPLVVLALAAWAVVALVRSRMDGPGRHRDADPSDRALDILRERYARGEVDEATFQRMRKDLEART